MSEQNNNNEGGEKLYAGKFKTVEELENGYKNSAAVYEENTTLKKKVDELSTVPDTYLNPADIQLDPNRVPDIQARAKEAGMTQAQYEKFLRNDKARVDARNQAFETAKKDVGEQTMNILNDYVSKHYPKELHDNMMRTFIADKNARQAALNHRDQLLNNKVPGFGNPNPPAYNVTDEDVRKAYAVKEKTKNPRDINRYLNLVSQQAAQERAS